jgi:hypothetical protein
MASRTGETTIARFESSNDFSPRVETGVQAIGNVHAKFQANLREMDEALYTEKGTVWKMDIHEWTLRLVATLFTGVIEPGDEDKVGGGIQIATIDRRGWIEGKVDRLKDLRSISWEQVSVGSHEVKQFSRENKLPPLASAESQPKAKSRSS